MAPKSPLPPPLGPARPVQKKDSFAPPTPYWQTKPAPVSPPLRSPGLATVQPALTVRPVPPPPPAPAVKHSSPPPQTASIQRKGASAPIGNASLANATGVIQRMNISTKSQAAIEDEINKYLGEIEDEGGVGTTEYRNFHEAYNMFDKGSNKSKIVNSITRLFGPKPKGRAKKLITWMSTPKNLTDSLRQENYGNSYNQAAHNKRNLYVNSHLTVAGYWLCPGVAGISIAHNAALGTETIDHIYSVARHWNAIGHNTSRKVRTDWYTDPINHRIICQSCNSKVGSGGKNYKSKKGPNYSN